MAKAFYINTKELTDLSLALQGINNVALPFAVQNTLNAIARDVKINTLRESANEQFDVKKKTFFTQNGITKAIQLFIRFQSYRWFAKGF